MWTNIHFWKLSFEGKKHTHKKKNQDGLRIKYFDYHIYIYIYKSNFNLMDLNCVGVGNRVSIKNMYSPFVYAHFGHSHFPKWSK